MSDEKASDELAAARFAAFRREVGEQVDSVKKKYGDQRGAVEKVIRAKGYKPKELGWLLAVSGMGGVPGTSGSPDCVVEAHREVLEAVASELGVDLKVGR